MSALCGDCTRGVALVKIVLRSPTPDSPFEYEQYSPIEMHKAVKTR